MAASGAGHGLPAAGRTVEQRHRAIVIGSGYGGAIAAYRPAEAGVPSVVLERGRRRSPSVPITQSRLPDNGCAWPQD